MLRKLLACSGLVAVACLTVAVTSASAHYPDVVASNVCVDGVASISVTATAWHTDLPVDHRVDHHVRIDVTGAGLTRTATGAFAAPDYSFATTFAVAGAEGHTLTVRVTSVAPWGPDEQYGYAGEFRETTVAVANPCPVPATTAVAPVVVITTPPVASSPVVVAPGTSSATPAPSTEVLGAVETQPQLAFTGRNSMVLAEIGAALFAGGFVALTVARRRRAGS